MRKHIKYMLDNKDKDARIVIGFMENTATIRPSLQTIRTTTAKRLISELKLVSIPGYKDCPRADIGASVYVFHENLHKY